MSDEPRKLNIVQMIFHDLGRHLSCYQKGSVRSPNIDKMAEEGVLFTNHFSTGTVCVPSRCSILTGRYPHSQELWRFGENEITLPKTLKAIGYETYRFGFHEEKEFQTLHRDMDRERMGKDLLGYDHTWKESRKTSDIVDRFCEFVENERPVKPFFADIAFYDVHGPNEADVEEERIEHTQLPEYLPQMPLSHASKKEMAVFEKRIEKADEAVGKVLDCLRSQRLTRDTLVYLTTDHGIDFPRAKMTVYDPGIAAALVFWGPDFLPKGKIDRHLHSHMDLFPTLMDIINKPIPNEVQGKSFADVLTGQEYSPRDAILAERAWEAPDDPVRAIRTNRYKYIRNYCPHWPIPIPPEYTKKAGVERIEKIYSNPRPFEELYDLQDDPYELNNLAEEDEFQDIKNRLWKALEKILAEDHDPVLELQSYLSYWKVLQDGRWRKQGSSYKIHL